MSTEKPRFTLTIDEDLLEEIDDFRFERRYPNRTQAVLELLRIGIAQVERGNEEHLKWRPPNDYENVLRERQEIQLREERYPVLQEDGGDKR